MSATPQISATAILFVSKVPKNNLRCFEDNPHQNEICDYFESWIFCGWNAFLVWIMRCLLHASVFYTHVCVCVCTYVHACVCVCACVSLEALLRLERRNLHHGARPVWVSFLVRLPHSPSSTHPLNSQSFTESISPPKNCFRNQLSIFKKSCSTPTTVLHRPNTIGPATV